ncbi:ABC transporter ATP-binding protein [Planococcus liqunii]|uniref:ABC transporter ATP-binding protein n=1 Tax=Planococcus liqunii TaxID=3058394 RepID=A0ABT8MSQ9_9BACL|nr:MULTISPECIES: ABC transporter ATP-binding protein [unclassified Planococcus (in: firmicutes)]MDN7227946.1 ABC transporter ATP-binding protein [Planococcus sp. N064]WKA50796.1 ABC transporter ATP-binding protein [Planococcus sp. N056]
MNTISVQNIQKSFAENQALKDVSFDIPKGEIFGFLGPSGSGKTTLLKILTAQLDPTSGNAVVLDKPAKMMQKTEQKKRFGILTDNSGLYERLTIEENLDMFRRLYDLPKSSIDEVLNFVNLNADRKKRISVLSKGMRQRVTLACAIIHEPEMLFLDEPTSALDPVNTMHIHKGLRYLNEKGTTIFLTTHDMTEAETLCERVAILHKGEIRAIGSPAELKKTHRDGTLTVELTTGQTERLAMNEDSAVRVASWMSLGQIDRIYTNELSLGDIFIKLTGSELV